MKDLSREIDECRRRGTRDLGGTLEWLRDEGCSKVDSAYVMVHGLEISLADAKYLIHNSRVWNDRKADDEAFHEAFVNAVNRLFHS